MPANLSHNVYANTPMVRLVLPLKAQRPAALAGGIDYTAVNKPSSYFGMQHITGQFVSTVGN